jgi:hypothetical protein
MIINSHLYRATPSRISATALEPISSILYFGSPIILNFSFDNPFTDTTIATVFNDRELIDLYAFSSTDNFIQVTEDKLGLEPGLKNIRIVFSNADADIDKIDYFVLHGYSSIVDSVYIYNSLDGYTLSEYLGNDANVLLPSFFIGVEGLRDVTTIGPSLFMNNTNISEVIISENTVSIGGSAFNGSSLTRITIPSRIVSIGGAAFLNCNQLVEIVVLAETPPTLLGDNVFDSIYPSIIKVPENSLNLYKEAPKWSEYADRIFSI